MFSSNLIVLALATLASGVLAAPTYDSSSSTGYYGAGCAVQNYTTLQPGYKFYCREKASGNNAVGTPSVYCEGDVPCYNVVCGCPEGTDNAILNDSNGWYVATCSGSSQ